MASDVVYVAAKTRQPVWHLMQMLGIEDIGPQVYDLLRRIATEDAGQQRKGRSRSEDRAVAMARKLAKRGR